MGVTKALDSGAVWKANQVTTSTTITTTVAAGAVEDANYPASNLKTPLRTKRVRVTYDDSDDTYDIVFDFGAAVTVTAIAFVDWNLPHNATVPVKIYADADDTSWDGPRWDIYPYAGDHGVARYYLDTATANTAISSARYWKIAFAGDYSIVESYLEIGEIVFAAYEDLTISTPFNAQVVDPSKRIQSYGGQEYVDAQTFYNKIHCNLAPMTQTAMYPLQTVIDTLGPAHTIFDAHASSASVDGASSAPGVLDKASTYYGRLSGGMKTQIKGSNNTVVGLTFNEARK